MKTNKFKNYIKSGVVLFLITIFLSSCTEEDFKQKQEQTTLSNIKLKTIDFSFFEQNKSLKSLVENIKLTKTKYHSKNNDENSFIIETDYILETQKNDVINYTFNIKRNRIDKTIIENFVISEKNNTFTFYIVTYQKTITNDKGIDFLSSLEIEDNLLYIINSGSYEIADIDINDPCIDIYFAPCDGVGTADGHDEVEGFCHGSMLIIDTSNCFENGNPGGPGYHGPDNEEDPTEGAQGGVPSSATSSGNTSTTTSPQSGLPNGALAPNNKSILLLESALGVDLDIFQEFWLQNNPEQIQELLDFANANPNSQPFTLEMIDFLIENDGVIHFDNTLTDTLDFNTVDEFQNYLDTFDNFETILDIPVVTEQNNTYTTEFIFRFTLVDLNVNVNSVLDNPTTTEDELNINNVSSNITGVTALINWEQNDAQITSVSIYTTIIIKGTMTYGVKILGNIATYSETWKLKVKINNQTGQAVFMEKIQ
jgi:hypothetical protein